MIPLLLCLLVSPGQAADYRNAEEVLAQFAGEPDIRAVHAMVLEYSKTDARYVEAWLAASKTAAALPELSLKYQYDNDYGNDYDYLTLSSDEEATASLSGADVDIGHGVEVKASWDLNKLVMSSERIRVISETQDIVKLRDKVLDEVTRLYFDRRRLQVDMLLNPGDLKAQLKSQLQLQELTAQIDAYTGGRFTAALKRSETR